MVQRAPDAIEETGVPAYRLSMTEPTPIANRVALLILQHPQEQDRALGTARLAVAHFANAVFKIGLSWPSLAAALGRPADPKHWAVLYLGSAKPAELAPEREIVVLDRRGEPVADQEAALAEIEGVVLLDGTWSQAKALWWRNPWVLKCQRIVLNPRQPSRYGAIRREPRRDSLSTLEAAGLVLSRLEGKPGIETELARRFERLLAELRPALRPSRARRGPPRRSHGGRR
jgi:DTW domain-containing protein YfiP